MAALAVFAMIMAACVFWWILQPPITILESLPLQEFPDKIERLRSNGVPDNILLFSKAFAQVATTRSGLRNITPAEFDGLVMATRQSNSLPICIRSVIVSSGDSVEVNFRPFLGFRDKGERFEKFNGVWYGRRMGITTREKLSEK